MPYEVRGGVAIHASELWPFVQGMQNLELSAFGASLAEFRKELKGATLLDTKRIRFAYQVSRMRDGERRKHCRAFLTKGLQKATPQGIEFAAYGQACLAFAHGTFQLLRDHRAKAFAAAIPRGVRKPDVPHIEQYLRKDQVFLLERFFYLLERERQHGIIVMDEIEKTEDRRFVRRLQNYFTKANMGRYRTAWIVPTPFFVASDMTYPVQAADLCIYCVNWGVRFPQIGMNAPVRREIADEFAPWIRQLQFHGERHRDGNTFAAHGIVFVPDPYTGRADA